MNNNDYREITEDDVTTVSTDQKEEMNGQESVNDTPDVSENEKETVQAEVTNSDASDEKEPEYDRILENVTAAAPFHEKIIPHATTINSTLVAISPRLYLV